MTEACTFGAPQPHLHYTERRAAYVVVTHDTKVAMVKARNQHFLPGGGSLPGETPEETIVREVDEELALSVLLIFRIGEAIQYFYSDADDRHYRMQASFFCGELTTPTRGKGEHELEWLPLTEAQTSCFHECHAWAISQV